MPRITVVTPNYNGAAWLERTLRSVLDQDYPNLEYIVVDGGSTDGSAAIIERFRARLAHTIIEPDHGHYDAIAKGFARATGEIFAWLNSDDIFMPWTLRTLAEIFTAHPQVEWITGLTCALHEGALRTVEPLCPRPREWVALGLLRDGGLGFLQQESTFWRADLYRRSGGLDTRFKLAGDYDLWRRFARHAELVSVSSVLGSFSYHGQNRSITQRGAYAQEVATAFLAQPAADQARARQVLAALHRERTWLFCRLRLGALLALPGFFLRAAAGPVLIWDSRDSAYHAHRQRLPLTLR